MGYYRCNSKPNENQIMPDGIVRIIINLFNEPLKWGVHALFKQNKNAMILEQDKTIAKFNCGGSGTSIFSDFDVFEGFKSKIDLKILNLPEWIVIGIINGDHDPDNDVNEEWPYFYKYGYGYSSDGGKFNDLLDSGKEESYGDGFCVEDVISINIDLISNTVSFEVNGKYQGVAFNIKQQNYKVFASTSHNGTQIELS